MILKMNLWNKSFQTIKDKTKTIEMRLCDEKRSLISIGIRQKITPLQKVRKMISS